MTIPTIDTSTVTLGMPSHVHTATLAARDSVAHLPPVQRIAILQHAIRLEQDELASKRDALRVELAEIDDAMAAMATPKAKRRGWRFQRATAADEKGAAQ